MYIENKGLHTNLNAFYKIVTLLDISVDEFFYPDRHNGEDERRKRPINRPPSGREAGADEVAEFPGAVIGRGIVVNVIVNVAFVGMGANKKLIPALCPVRRRFIADPVGPRRSAVWNTPRVGDAWPIRRSIDAIEGAAPAGAFCLATAQINPRFYKIVESFHIVLQPFFI